MNPRYRFLFIVFVIFIESIGLSFFNANAQYNPFQRERFRPPNEPPTYELEGNLGNNLPYKPFYGGNPTLLDDNNPPQAGNPLGIVTSGPIEDGLSIFISLAACYAVFHLFHSKKNRRIHGI